MNRISPRSVSLGALVVGSLALAPIGLGGCDKKAGDLVRPDERTANDALGEGKCDEEAIKADANPLVVDWSDSDRAALESEMSKGVALVQYTCDGVKVLKGCAVEGVYSYAGVSRKTKVISMEDMSSVRANLTAGKLPAEIKAELDRGATLDLAYVLVGTESTTVTSVVRGDLPAERCAAATHFVYDAQVGAFAMQTGAAGQAKAAVDILGRGASAGTASSKSTRTTDGDPDACETAGSSTPAPVDGCQALLRVTLFPLETGDAAVAAAPKAKGTVDGRGGCPDGFRYVDGACEKAASVQHYLCEKGNVTECKEQCAKGSLESCGRLANHVLTDMIDASEEEVTPYIQPLRDSYARACTEAAEADACTLAGFAILLEVMADQDFDVNAESSKRPLQNMMDYLEQGCRGGETMSCDLMKDVYLEGGFDPVIAKDVKRYYDIVQHSCHAGAAASCGIASREYAFGTHVSVDLAKATEFGKLGCYGGVATDCVMVGSIMLGQNFCGQMMQAYREESQTTGASAENAHAFNDQEINAMCRAAAPGDPTEDGLADAQAWYQRGCHVGDAISCSIVDALKG